MKIKWNWRMKYILISLKSNQQTSYDVEKMFLGKNAIKRNNKHHHPQILIHFKNKASIEANYVSDKLQV